MTRDTDTTEGRQTASLRAVVSGADAAPRALTQHSAAMADFIAYWQSLRRGSDLPRRSDVDPRGIESLLAYAFIAERIAPGLARLRIAGSHLTDLMGMEVRGMPVSAFITPAYRNLLSEQLVRVFDQPAMLRLSLGSEGTPRLAGEMLILPLRSDLGDISRALGCLVTEGNIGRGPRRLDILHAQTTPLEGAVPRVDATGTRAGSAAPRILPIQGKPIDGADAEPPHQKGERPYLRLVKG
ncbi:MAG TPA: PAS domain-containing protein [Roseovarius sp.]